ncbi:armadillo-type protein [Syncephalis fuscata]|nr:armadillo-type protein [Syncephalis fuscata]
MRGNVAKELNKGEGSRRFKFQTFKTRIDSVKLNVVHRVHQVQDTPEESDSFFRESLEEWKDLNLTTAFRQFTKQVEPYTISLAQLLYHKEKIVDLLEQFIDADDGLALEPFLSLLTVLSKDLQEEFYPYFPRVLACIVKLLKYRDVEVVEWSFNAIAYLYKHLSKSLVADLIPTYHLIEPLLQAHDNRAYIRNFAAESFSFLLRKARGDVYRSVVEVILSSLQSNNDPELINGVAVMFYECVKNVDNRLHSRTAMILGVLIDALLEQELINQQLVSPLQQMLSRTILLIEHNTPREHIDPLWQLLLSTLEKTSTTLPLNITSLLRCMDLLRVYVGVRKGSRVLDFTPLLIQLKRISEQLLSTTEGNETSLSHSTFLSLLVPVLMYTPWSVILSNGKTIIDRIFQYAHPSNILVFCETLGRLEWPHCHQLLLTSMINYTAQYMKQDQDRCLLFWSMALQYNYFNLTKGTISAVVTPQGQLRLPNKDSQGQRQMMIESLLSFLVEPRDWSSEMTMMNDVHIEMTSSHSIITQLSLLLQLVGHIAIPWRQLWSSLKVFIQQLIETLQLSIDDTYTGTFVQRNPTALLQNLLGQSLVLVIEACQRDNTETAFKDLYTLNDTIHQCLPQCRNNPLVLKATGQFLGLMNNVYYRYPQLLSSDMLVAQFDRLKLTLSSTIQASRQYAVEILALYDQFPLLATEQSSQSNEPCQLLNDCALMEQVPNTVRDYRGKFVYLRKWASIAEMGRLPPIYEEALSRLCIGMFTVNLSVLWPESIAALKRVAIHDGEIVWRIIIEQLSRFEDETQLAENNLKPELLAICNNLTSNEIRQLHPVKETAAGQGGLSLSCPNLTRLTVAHQLTQSRYTKDLHTAYYRAFVTNCELSGERVDYWNYYRQLLLSLTELPTLAEKHSRGFVPMFLRLYREDYRPSLEQDDAEETNHHKGLLLERSARVTHDRMTHFLKLFGKIRNPGSLYKSTELSAIYWQLLSKGEQKIQGLALDCLLMWRPKNVLDYADHLRNLLDDYKFRDELAAFSLAPGEEGAIHGEHRSPLMPYVIRILYGRMVGRKGRGSAKTSMGARRTAILAALGSFQPEELLMFIDLMLEPFTEIRTVVMLDTTSNDRFEFDETAAEALYAIPLRRQIGLLIALEDVLKQLGARLTPHLPMLFSIVMYLARHAHIRMISLSNEDNEEDRFEREQMKQIRQQSLRRFVDFFRLNVILPSYQQYMPAMFSAFLSERVEQLDVESTQSPSAVLEMFVAWSSTSEYASYLIDYNNQVIAKCLSCLSAKKVQLSVISAVLTLIEQLLDLPELDAMLIDKDVDEPQGMASYIASSLTRRILKPYIPQLLVEFNTMLVRQTADKTSDTALIRREISILSRVASLVDGEHQVQQLVELLVPFLRKPNRHVPEYVKADILRIVVGFLPLIDALRTQPALFNRYYNEFATLLARLSTRDCRLLLAEVMMKFAQIDPSLTTMAELVGELNAFTGRRLGEPDFERRLAAFSRVNDHLYAELSTQQWTPLLYCYLFAMHDTEELAIRGSAAYGLRRFIDQVKLHLDDATVSSAWQTLLVRIVYSGVRRALKTRAEVVRQEAVLVLAHMTQQLASLPLFASMTCLLADGDEEASFLHNVYHIQLHRRIRAIQRLGQMCQQGRLSAMILTQLILPLLDHFLFDTDRIADHNLINATIITVGEAAGSIPWSAYYGQIRKFLRAVKTKPDIERIMVRALMSTLEHFHFDLSKAEVDINVATMKKYKVEPAPEPEPESKDKEVDNDTVDEEEEENDAEDVFMDASSGSFVPVEMATRIHTLLTTRLLPELMTFIRPKDEESVRMRVPMALSLAKILRQLPETSLRIQLPGLVVILCQSLRYKTQDARDCTRDTLNKLALFLGPSYLRFMVVELRNALTRGSQRHVLGYTLHSLLANLQPTLKPNDLTQCLDLLMSVIVEDIFGAIGEEKETEELTGKTKEMRSMRSYDSYEILARIVPYDTIDQLVLPIKDIMSETASMKVMKKVDQILVRLATGISHNPDFKAYVLVQFCHGLIALDAKIALPKQQIREQKSMRDLNYEVQLVRDNAEKRDYYAANVHRFVELGLTVLLTAFKRNRFDISNHNNKEHLGWLNKLVDAVGNASYSQHASVMAQSFKVLAILCPLPLNGLNNGRAAIVKRAFEVLSKSTDTGLDLSQSCFRLLTVVIRQCPQVTVSEVQLTFLVNLIKPDIEETEKQTTTFNLIRAMVARKFVSPEVYDLMDAIRELLVTSQTDQVRIQCRQIYLQFLLEYPQGDKRMKTQLNFLASNLAYVHESGRESVMELLHAVITKFDASLLAPYWEMFMLALVLALVNDESSQCREMAGSLIRVLLKRVNETSLNNIHKMLVQWYERKDSLAMQRAAIQTFGLMVESLGQRTNQHIGKWLPYIEEALTKPDLAQIDANEEDVTSSEAQVAGWELIYFSLSTFTKIVKQFPDTTYAATTIELWRKISALQLYPHTWIRLSSARLLGLYFSKLDTTTLKVTNLPNAPTWIETSQLKPLSLTMGRQLKSPVITDDMGTQVVKNLFFIARCLYAQDKLNAPSKSTVQDNEEEEEEEEEAEEETEANTDVKTGQQLLGLFKRLSLAARLDAGRTQSLLQVI